MVKNKKAKGSNSERELFHMLWENSWGCVRVAGSGSTTRPAPDLLAGDGKRMIAIECKAVGDDKKYFNHIEIEELIEFSRMFGAEAWIAVKFDNKGWWFIPAEKLKKSKGNNFSADLEFLKKEGLIFDELIGKFKQNRLI